MLLAITDPSERAACVRRYWRWRGSGGFRPVVLSAGACTDAYAVQAPIAAYAEAHGLPLDADAIMGHLRDTSPSPADLLDDLIAHVDGSRLAEALARYEATGDHDHGRGPTAPGAPCPGGDCWVTRARLALARLRDQQPEPAPGPCIGTRSGTHYPSACRVCGATVEP